MLSVQKLLEQKPNRSIWSVSPGHMVIDALTLMAEKNIGAVVVMEGDKLVGIFSERDYARRGIIQGRKSKTTPVADVMTSNLYTVTPVMNIEDCMQLMSDKRIRHLPVMDGETLVGVLSIGDIVTAIIRSQTEHIQFLEQYITGR